MIIFKPRTATFPGLWLRASIVSLGGFLLSGVLQAQIPPANSPTGPAPASAGPSSLAQVPPKLFPEFKARDAQPHGTAATVSLPAGSAESTIPSGNPRRITIE